MKANLHVSHAETNLGFAVCNENGKTVCVTKDKPAAIFFAAAPDLLAALEAIREITQNATGICMEIDAIASAAIARARG